MEAKLFPTRLSIATYNLWGKERWPEREPALRQFAQLFCPDVLCLQEFSPETGLAIEAALPQHRRVRDDFEGWSCESNIYWNSDLLELVGQGAEDIGMVEQYRRLFWVHLRLKDRNRFMFVSTAHFTWPGEDREYRTGQSPRPQYTRNTIEALTRLTGENEPVFFMGDLNDPIIPTRILHGAGYVSCFAALGLQSPPTWQSYPTAQVAAGEPVTNQTVDWIFGNRHARAVSAQVPQCFYGDLAPSDHWPVHAVYEI